MISKRLIIVSVLAIGIGAGAIGTAYYLGAVRKPMPRGVRSAPVTASRQPSGTCSTSQDCPMNLYGDCGGELCIPQWKVFCEASQCIRPRSADEWNTACSAKKQDADFEACVAQAAFAQLRRSSQDENYTIIYGDALAMCRRHIGVLRSGDCKAQVCENLHLGDGGMKGTYPETKNCERDALLP